MLGFPTTANFKHIIQLSQIRNCPVTLKDIDNAEKIFGNNIASLKSTRRKPPIIKEDFIEIPPKILEHNKAVTLNIDNMFISGLPQLKGIDKTVCPRHCLPLASRTKNEFYKAIDVITRKYNSAGFMIKRINSDQELQPIMDLIKDDMDIENAEKIFPTDNTLSMQGSVPDMKMSSFRC